MLKLKEPRKSLRGLAWIDALKKALHCLWFWMADFLTFCYSHRHWSQRADGERFPDATRIVHSKGSTRNHVDDTEKVWL